MLGVLGGSVGRSCWECWEVMLGVMLGVSGGRVGR